MKNTILLLALLTSCAVDPAGLLTDVSTATPDHDDPVLDDAGPVSQDIIVGCGTRPVTKLIGAPDFHADVAGSTFRRTFMPTFNKLGSFAPPAMHQDQYYTRATGIVSINKNYETAFALIPADSGDKITGISWWACGDGVAGGSAGVWIAPSYAMLTTSLGGSNEWHGTGVDFKHADQWSVVTMHDFLPKVIGDSDYVGLFFTAYEPGYVVGAVTVTFERPPATVE